MATLRIASGTYACAFVDDTRALGRTLGTLLRAGDVVVLTGDLGAGKTQLTKGIADGMGIADDITSPTFTIGMTYRGSELELHHYDLYRLDDAGQLEDTGILDVAGGDGVCVVEWGEDYVGELGDDRLDVSITRVARVRGADNSRDERAGDAAVAAAADGRATAAAVDGHDAADAADGHDAAAAGSGEPMRRVELTGTGPRGRTLVDSLDKALGCR